MGNRSLAGVWAFGRPPLSHILFMGFSERVGAAFCSSDTEKTRGMGGAMPSSGAPRSVTRSILLPWQQRYWEARSEFVGSQLRSLGSPCLYPLLAAGVTRAHPDGCDTQWVPHGTALCMPPCPPAFLSALPPLLALQVDKRKAMLFIRKKKKRKELMEGKTALSLCCHQGLPFPQPDKRHQP